MTARLGVLLLAASCSRPAPWPAFPKDDAARDALINERTLRPVPPATDYSAQAVFDAAEKLGWATLPAGEKRVYAWIEAQHPKWLLFGTFHDSAGQLDAFRHLVGPGGIGAFDRVALEYLVADGRWRDFPGDQRADGGVRYTTWKYGYGRNLDDLIRATHALPCDAPHTRDERLRELHCLLSLRDVIAPADRVAMLWGEDHVTSEGFRRFLPPGEKTLSLFTHGARWSIDDLRDRLLLDEPVLVPLGEGEAALLLPNGHVERAHSDPGGQPLIRASALQPGTLRVGSTVTALTEDESVIALPAGEYTYAFEATGGLRVVGSLEVGGDTELIIDPANRATRQLISP